MVVKRFKSVGTKFDDEFERLKLVATKLHSLEWARKDKQQDTFAWEEYNLKMNMGSLPFFKENIEKELWEKKGHQEYLDLAKQVLEQVDFESAVTMLDLVKTLQGC